MTERNPFFVAMAATPFDGPTAMRAFMARYSIEQGGPNAPLLFVTELLLAGMVDPTDPSLPASPDAWQVQVLRWYGEGERRIAIKSGHGVGKSTVCAWIALHHLYTKFPQKTAITAPTTGQLFDVLYPEIKTWHSKMPLALQGMIEIKSDRIELTAAPSRSYLTAKTSRPETPEALAGIHSDHVLLIPDEGSGVPEPVFVAASGSMSGHNAITIIPGNPVRTSGLFFDIFHKEAMRTQWKTLTVSCLDSKRVSADYVADMAARYGVDSNAYRVRVLGEFPIAGLNNVIAYESVVAASLRDIRVNPVAPRVWGLDVARFGDDSTCLCKRQGNKVYEEIQEWFGKDLMQTAALVKAEWDRTPKTERPEEVLIDSIGLGAGVVDRLQQLGLPAFGVNVSEAAALNEQYLNLRAELWFMGKDWFQRLDCSIPRDEHLMGQLAGVQYKFTKSGKFQVESKDEMKKRGMKSPNRADAFLLTFAGAASVLTNNASGTGYGFGKELRRNIKGVV